jgi:hypothetical protein
MREDLHRTLKSGCFLRRRNEDDALDGDTLARNLDYRGPNKFLVFGAVSTLAAI